jgi:RimJ/RimL family protein N-acetyltransferase
MAITPFTLTGRHVRLEPLELRHAGDLVAASANSPELYRWSPVPQTEQAAIAYIRTALQWREDGTAMAFATVRAADGVVIGSTRFFDLAYWGWPEGHARRGRAEPDVCEIGYTWLRQDAVRTAANTEAKLLMLAHAFDVWGILRVCFHTDIRNERSRAALGRIGAKFEAVLRSHRIAADFTPRDSARFSILAAEWPDVRAKLETRLS